LHALLDLSKLLPQRIVLGQQGFFPDAGVVALGKLLGCAIFGYSA
jgi:hypothetical protein